MVNFIDRLLKPIPTPEEYEIERAQKVLSLIDGVLPVNVNGLRLVELFIILLLPGKYFFFLGSQRSSILNLISPYINPQVAQLYE
ncbi:MAG TPA: hypothetical protein VFG77_06825 [Nitrososphaeraceae archaeon]|nr:hypothetical protein [Nitrososphaeraceae archaeon]